MSKTAPIPDDAHALVVSKQTELKTKHKITVKISDLIAMYIKDSVKRTEKLLGLNVEEKLDGTGDTKQNIASDREEVDGR